MTRWRKNNGVIAFEMKKLFVPMKFLIFLGSSSILQKFFLKVDKFWWFFNFEVQHLRSRWSDFNIFFFLQTADNFILFLKNQEILKKKLEIVIVDPKTAKLTTLQKPTPG